MPGSSSSPSMQMRNSRGAIRVPSCGCVRYTARVYALDAAGAQDARSNLDSGILDARGHPASHLALERAVVDHRGQENALHAREVRRRSRDRGRLDRAQDVAALAVGGAVERDQERAASHKPSVVYEGRPPVYAQTHAGGVPTLSASSCDGLRDGARHDGAGHQGAHLVYVLHQRVERVCHGRREVTLHRVVEVVERERCSASVGRKRSAGCTGAPRKATHSTAPSVTGLCHLAEADKSHEVPRFARGSSSCPRGREFIVERFAKLQKIKYSSTGCNTKSPPQCHCGGLFVLHPVEEYLIFCNLAKRSTINSRPRGQEELPRAKRGTSWLLSASAR